MGSIVVVGGGLAATARATKQHPRVVMPWLPPTPKVHANRLRRAASEGALTKRIEATPTPMQEGASGGVRPQAALRPQAM